MPLTETSIQLKGPSPLLPARCSMRTWIAEKTMRARKTILIAARSKAEAQQKLDAGGGEGVDIEYYSIQRAKVIRRDKASNDKSSNPASQT